MVPKSPNAIRNREFLSLQLEAEKETPMLSVSTMKKNRQMEPPANGERARTKTLTILAT